MRGTFAPIPTAFFGRESDLRRIDDLVHQGRRVITLVGPAGAGKTRLARRFAETHDAEISGGVWFCDLGGARDVAGVLTAVGHALDVPLARAATGARGIEAIAHAIATLGPTLLILDNCEQAIDAAAMVVKRIIELAHDAILVVTSRESLRAAGEQVHIVAPLAIDGAESDAVRLFVDRAKSVWPAFVPTAEDAETLREIVQRLDGLPLAIELAAARAGTLSLRTIRQRLEERFTLLAGGDRFAAERQRTMRAAIDWSWDLLTPVEQSALADCSIFRGGFSLEAAEHVLDTEDAPPVLDVLGSLVQKSLVTVREVPELGERRFHLLDSIREYALAKLRAAAREDRALERHRAYFTRAGAAWSKQAPPARLAVELDNLLEAHRHALGVAANDAFTLLGVISEVLKRRGPLELLLSVLDATLADERAIAHSDPTLVAEALRDRAYARQFAPGSAAGKVADLTRALEIARQTHDSGLELDCLAVFVSVELLNGNPEAARTHARTALGRAREGGDARTIARACADLGSCDLSVGRFEEARACFQEAITLTRRVGDQLGCALYLARLAEVLIELGRLDEAMSCTEEGVAMCRPFEHHRQLASLAGVRGAIEYERRELDRARAFFDEALEHARRWGAELLEPYYRAVRGAVLADGDHLDAAVADIDYAEAQLPRFGDDSVLLATVATSRGHLDLARARAAATRGDVDESIARRTSAERRLDGLRAFRHVFEDLRPMRRRLERELARAHGEALKLASSDAPERNDALVVAEDGRWFRPPNGERIDLSSRPNLQRLLVALATHRIGASNEPMSLDAVFRSGWPGDRSHATSAANRARVAVARLRKLGLGDLLLGRGGYQLDPDVPIVIARTRR